jgi:hypothetical protein
MAEKLSRAEKAIKQENIPVTSKEKSVIKKAEKIKEKKKLKLSHRFVYALSFVSILGFIGIISKTFFNYDLHIYTESFLMLIIGAGMILESKAKNLIYMNEVGLTSTNFAHLITLIMGVIAIVAGVFSLPQIYIGNSIFLATKGIIAIISVVVIIVETWFIE